MRGKIIVNADDFGLCHSVNTAIINGFLAGNISSTTIMANMPGRDEAVQLAKKHPELGIGLHFCITEGQSLCDASSITNSNGEFYNWKKINSLLLNGKVNKGDIYNELEAQYFNISNEGIKITHIDSHQHIHMNNSVFEVCKSFIKDKEIAIRLVDPNLEWKLFFKRPKKALKQYLLKTLSIKHRLSINNKTNDSLISIHDLNNLKQIDKGSYKLLWDKNKCLVTELMVHPYINGNDLKSYYAKEWRDKEPFFNLCFKEHDVLKKAGIIEHLTGCKPIRYDQI
jgi:hypothetical protein